VRVYSDCKLCVRSYSPTRVVIAQDDGDDEDSGRRTVIGDEEGTAPADAVAVTLETVVEEDDENGEQRPEEDRLLAEPADDDGGKNGDSEAPVRRFPGPWVTSNAYVRIVSRTDLPVPIPRFVLFFRYRRVVSIAIDSKRVDSVTRTNETSLVLQYEYKFLFCNYDVLIQLLGFL